MANFVLRLLKRKGVDKTKRRSHRKDLSDSEDEKDDDEGVVESKFDYDEGVMSSIQNIQASQNEFDADDVCWFIARCIHRRHLRSVGIPKK